MGYAEITREAFNALVGKGAKCSKVKYLEHASKAYYYCHGVELLQIDNYLSCTSQFYILDINA